MFFSHFNFCCLPYYLPPSPTHLFSFWQLISIQHWSVPINRKNFQSWVQTLNWSLSRKLSFLLRCQVHVHLRPWCRKCRHWCLKSNFESYPLTQQVSKQILRVLLVKSTCFLQVSNRVSAQRLSGQFTKTTHYVCDQCHIFKSCLSSTEPNNSMVYKNKSCKEKCIAHPEDAVLNLVTFKRSGTLWFHITFT